MATLTLDFDSTTSGNGAATLYDETPVSNPATPLFANVSVNTGGTAADQLATLVLQISPYAGTMGFTLTAAATTAAASAQVSFDPITVPGQIRLHYEGLGDGPADSVWTQILAGLRYSNTQDVTVGTTYNVTVATAATATATYGTIVSGTDLVTVTCFYAGTHIATPDGERPIEALAVGDRVTLADGSSAPVRWIGRQTVSRAFADPARTLPIRIAADALAEHQPSRDLLVSPGHALFMDGILVLASALVNGLSIVQETDVPSTFVYYHVELAGHALILAEGVSAESFVDNVERISFDNWAEHEALYPDRAPMVEMELPRAMSSRQVPHATRERLMKRALALFGHVRAAA